MPSVDEIAELLARTPLFRDLDAPQREHVAEAMREQRFDAGQVIFTRDEPSTSLYLIVEGRVRLSVLNADGRELTFRFVDSGDIMGEIAALDGGPRTADAVAVTAVCAMILPQVSLTRIMRSEASVVYAALQLLCTRLRDTSTQLEEIALYPIERRVARFLVSALRLSAHDMSQPEVMLDLKMTQAEMALLLGTSRPKVNVALAALEGDGAISRTGETLVCRPPRLLRIAGIEEA